MTETSIAARDSLTGSDTRRRVWAIVGASSGNLVEWFDFYVYSFCSLYFAHIFFPAGNTTTQLLQTAGVFAAGFLMRPIGGWLFGRLADRHGRKKSMLISVCMMCFGSLVIACLPGYATIGTWAPALLLLARLFQGLSVGGEYGTSATYMSEVAVEGRKGFYASFQYVTLIGGQLLALLVVVVLQQVLSSEDLHAWGWRIPFAMHANTASILMTAALFVFMLIQPIIGALSDKIGRRTSMLIFGGLATVCTVPVLSALQSVTSPIAAFALVMCALLIVSFYTSISGILKAEMFPAQVRALGVGLSYAVANALFGGSAEYVALSLKSVGVETAFFWYVTLMGALAFLVSLMLHAKGKGLRL
ncbi:MFS transporter [Trabulsiella odontotermitis]|uniref:MFS transporter n=1 Tax=Trabulsiella odontotermitis TaxID=379893 RepID=UPI0006768E7E|nr:MFS transporter [Trabulsiella odontotermitis]KNC90366.1 alpha-ketoglutarate transporter [Trabulsiella odontotermitis]